MSDALAAVAARYGTQTEQWSLSIEHPAPFPHEHHGSEIYGEMGSAQFVGDIWARAWDGAVPADLSGGADTGATAGYYLDSDAGVGQFQTIYAEGGSFTGTIDANAGTIGALTVDGTLTIGASGTVNIGAGSLTINGASGTITGTNLTIATDGSITAGNVSFTSGSFTGTISTTNLSATGGSISNLTASNISATGWFTASSGGGFRTATSGESVRLTGAGTLELYNSSTVKSGELWYNSSNTRVLLSSTSSVKVEASSGNAIMEGSSGTLLRHSGSDVALFQTAGVTFYQDLWAPSGSAANPGYNFLVAHTVGMYLSGTADLSFSAGGTRRFWWDNSSVLFTVDYPTNTKMNTGGTAADLFGVNTAGSQYTIKINTSALKYKKNIQPWEPPPGGWLPALAKIEPVSYLSIPDDDDPAGQDDTRYVGVIADWLEDVFPELMVYDAKGDLLSFQYNRLPVVNAAALVELWGQVEDLRRRVAELEAA